MKTTKPTISKADELRQAIVDYRVKCDMAYSELQDKFYTEAQYHAAIDWELENLVALIADQQRQLLDRVDTAVPERRKIDYCPSENCHYNFALDDVHTVIKDIREGLK